MTELVAHRGPDGSGYWREENVEFGHRRLAIVDLSIAGHQPFHYQNRYVLTYNGEIYNHHELREELKSHGYQFHSHTDTEVILAAYDRWGSDCLHKLNGMWGFILYDRHKKMVFAARDRFGVKPLYYWISPDRTLAFASEIKQFTALNGWKPQSNEQIASDFLLWGISDHTEETFFSGVFQFEPGTCFIASISDLRDQVVSAAKLTTRKWYELPQTTSSKSFEEAVSEFRNLLADSVRIRMKADVSVGSCLSGGLDSSSIVSFSTQALGAIGSQSRLKTFSAYSENKQLDESHFVEELIRSQPVENFSVTPQYDNLRENLNRLAWHLDEPFGSSSVFAQWTVFELAKANQCKVLLDGQGADEQLAGYPEFLNAYFAELLAKFHFLRLFQEIGQFQKARSESIFKSFARAIVPYFSTRGLSLLMSFGHQRSKMRLKLNSSKKVVLTDPYTRSGHSRTSVKKLSRSEMGGLHLQSLLRYEDRNSMAHSIESRVPFLDFRLAEFIISLPSSYKIGSGFSKRLLREAMIDRIPEAIRLRQDKIGFATAEEVWMKKDPDYFRRLLEDAVKASNGFIHGQVLSEFDQMISGKSQFDFVFWRLISFGLWLRSFNVRI